MFLCLFNSSCFVTALRSLAPSSLAISVSPTPSIAQPATNISLRLPTLGAPFALTYWPTFPYTVDLLLTDTSIIFTSDYDEIGSITQKWEAERLFKAEIKDLSFDPRRFSPLVFSVARSFTKVNLTCHGGSSGSWTVETAIEMLQTLESLVARWGAKDLDFEIWQEDQKKVICALRLGNSSVNNA